MNVRSPGLAFVVSGLVHVCVFAWAFNSTVPSFGSGGEQLEAISVEIVRSAATESESQQTVAASSASQAPPALAQTPPLEKEQQAVEETTTAAKRPAETRPEPAPADTVDRKPDPDGALTTSRQEPPPQPEPVVVERPIETPPVTTPTPPEPKPVADLSQTPQDALSAGGSPARAAPTPQVTAPGAAGASPGQVARYAIEVRKALARTPPKYVGRRGKVIVGFELTDAGAARLVDVVKSSGNDRLDQAAITSIRAAKFPTPPFGMTAKQLSYTVPFDFN